MLQPNTPFGAWGPALSRYASLLSFLPALKQKGAKEKKGGKKKRRKIGLPYKMEKWLVQGRSRVGTKQV